MPRVLVVDDELGMRKLLAQALELEGIETVPAAGGRAALHELCKASAQGDVFDAMVLDIVMPDIDGWQVLEAVKNNPLWRDLPLVVVSGYAKGSAEIARVSRYDGIYVAKKDGSLSLVRAALGRLIGAAQAC